MARVPQMLTSREAARADKARPAFPRRDGREDDHTEEGHTIKGKPASAIEWAVYVALRGLGWDDEFLDFQVAVYGGRSRFGGGQVLDFVVNAGPRSAVIDVRGFRYHGPSAGRSAADRWREIQIAALPDSPRVIVVWEDVAHQASRLRSLLLRELGARR